MDNPIKVVILDGGGTVWYSMDVLWRHYQAAFGYFGLLWPQDFEKQFPLEPTTLISSLRSFNSRRNMPVALLAMHFTKTKPDDVLNKRVKGYEGRDPESCLKHLFYTEAWDSHTGILNLSQEMGKFLADALDHYDEINTYPPCKNACEGVKELHQLGYKLGLLSNRKRVSTERIIHKLNLRDYFDYVEAPDAWEEPVKKPVKKILDHFRIDPENPIAAVFIGDSNVDINSARTEKLFTIAVRGGMGDDIVWEIDPPAERAQDLMKTAKLLSSFDDEQYRERYVAYIR